MTRRRMTQIFPWLLPLRRWQRRFCFYAKMGWDGIPYATCRERQELPYPLFETSCPMYNRETGFDMVYQENKVFNLKLAAAHPGPSAHPPRGNLLLLALGAVCRPGYPLPGRPG